MLYRNKPHRDEEEVFPGLVFTDAQNKYLPICKKTFTRWMNIYLTEVDMDIGDLYVDLTNGKKLIKLLEIISGEELTKPSYAHTRVHMIDNVNIALNFLHTKNVHHGSINAEAIVAGDQTVTLELIWKIIWCFEIEPFESREEGLSAKNVLLLWVQRKTQGYNGVVIEDYSGSWRNGLGFNALIHAYNPELVSYDELQPCMHIDNLNCAFDVANRALRIPRLLDAEDVDVDRPDEICLITYLAFYYRIMTKKNETAISN